MGWAEDAEKKTLIQNLLDQIGLSQTTIIALIDAEQADERAAIRAQEARIEARLRELDKEERRINKLLAQRAPLRRRRSHLPEVKGE